eukprot:scaffold5364_cov164-Amphora_coffeaeformis.AAC.17
MRYYKGGYKGKGGYYKMMKWSTGKGEAFKGSYGYKGYYKGKGKGKGYYKGGYYKKRPMGVWKRKANSIWISITADGGGLFGDRLPGRPPSQSAPTPTTPTTPTAPTPTTPNVPTVPTPTTPTVPTVPTPTTPTVPTVPTPTAPVLSNIDWITDFSIANVDFVETQTQYIEYDDATMEGNSLTNTFTLPPGVDIEVYIVNTENGPIAPADSCPPGDEADRELVYEGSDLNEIEIEFAVDDETFVMCDADGNVIAAKEVVFQPVPPPFGEFELVYTDPLDFSSASADNFVEIRYLYQEDTSTVFGGFLSNTALGADDSVYFITPDGTFTPECPPNSDDTLSFEEYIDPSDEDDELAVGIQFDASNGEIQYVLYCDGDQVAGVAEIGFFLV